MIFSLNQATRFSTSQNRQTAELASGTPTSRKVVPAGQIPNHQRTPASGGMFGVLVSNGTPQGRRF